MAILRQWEEGNAHWAHPHTTSSLFSPSTRKVLTLPEPCHHKKALTNIAEHI